MSSAVIVAEPTRMMTGEASAASADDSEHVTTKKNPRVPRDAMRGVLTRARRVWFRMRGCAERCAKVALITYKSCRSKNEPFRFPLPVNTVSKVRPRVLIVEDEPAVAAGIAAALDDTMDVDTCSSAETALVRTA